MSELKEIIKGCLSGSSRDQELLYRRYSAKLFGISLQYTGSSEESKDVLQESFIKIFTNLRNFNGDGSLGAWMRRIVVNTALEKYRNKYYLNRVDDFGNIPEPFVDEVDDVYNVSEIEPNDLLQYIMDLPPKYRMSFNLYVMDGYSHKEISKMLSISDGTSKSNLSRARSILRKKIEKHLGMQNKLVNG